MLPRLLEIVRDKGHVVFTRGVYNLNIVGVRTKGRPNTFDDRICVVYRDATGWITREYPATTDPGVYWLENPMNVEGTAVLVPGQYRGCYKIDKHRGQYDALCQRLGKVRVWRDGDKDAVIDWDEHDEIAAGFYGINIHRSSGTRTSENVNKWSAGCQVFQDPDDFDAFINLCKKSVDMWGNAFTYTLIEDN